MAVSFNSNYKQYQIECNYLYQPTFYMVPREAVGDGSYFESSLNGIQTLNFPLRFARVAAEWAVAWHGKMGVSKKIRDQLSHALVPGLIASLLQDLWALKNNSYSTAIEYEKVGPLIGSALLKSGRLIKSFEKAQWIALPILFSQRLTGFIVLGSFLKPLQGFLQELIKGNLDVTLLNASIGIVSAFLSLYLAFINSASQLYLLVMALDTINFILSAVGLESK